MMTKPNVNSTSTNSNRFKIDRRRFLSTAGAVAAGSALAGCTGGSGEEFLSLATGSTGGSWFPIGGALADLWSDELDYSVTAESTGGAIENVRLISGGDADVGIIFGNTALEAINGEGEFDEASDIEAVFGMFQAQTHMVSLSDAEVTSSDDLADLRVSTGTPGSGTSQVAAAVLEWYGVMDEIDERQLDLQEQADAMRNDQLDVGFWSNPIPSPSVEELATQREVDIYDFAPDIDDITTEIDFMTEATIPAGTYPDQDDPIANPGISNFMFVPAGEDDELVYDLTATTFENLDRIGPAHPAIGEFEESARAVTIPMHPAAEDALDDLGL